MFSRFLMVRQGCEFCRNMIKVVNKINLRLPIDKRINIIDCWEFEQFGLDNIPLIKKLEKDGLEHGYPFLYCDGAVIEPSPTPEQLRIILENFLSEDLLY